MHIDQKLIDHTRAILDDIVQEINECKYVLRILDKRVPHMTLEKRLMMQNAETAIKEMDNDTREVKDEFEAITKIVDNPVELKKEDPMLFMMRMMAWHTKSASLKRRNHERVVKFIDRMKEIFGADYSG